ncbi:HAMP domain-containing histidine kinase [Fodinisporobacter ferrooxydans]|uniref:histidine kinase n=1 Tax=Fodinisporobacter ferrooxydans TaxID=2901836 RepID=A0ABY4CP84_9BACL|nr:HAMP domain-containing histidine kinase [Alicyclobacillaceae bacterium MYW30-H2]
MFKQTRIRLILLNSIVFFIILNGFGATTYFYMKHRMYNQGDMMMRSFASHLKQIHFRDLFYPKSGERGIDRRYSYIFWNDKGQVLLQLPSNSIYPEDIRKLKSKLGKSTIQTVDLSSQTYRLFTIHFNQEDRLDMPLSHINAVQIIENIEPLEEMFDSLLIVILVSGSISIGVAFFIGLFLANRALIPIQRSWNKQQQFAADASHELRTPLTVIKLYLERLFRHPDHTIEQESEHIANIIGETRRMHKLIEELLLLARTDSNRLQIMIQTVYLDDILKRVVQDFQEMSRMKDIQIYTSIESPIKINGDKERLHQMFVILLDNALKYTKVGGHVTVSCEHIGATAKIVIKDNGIGIPKDDLPYIFDCFFRGDKARNRTSEGTGLGLSIARWVIENHGGKVRVESEVGIGTSFFINLPLKLKLS